MSYTDYGLTEGLGMLILPLIIISAVFGLRLIKKSKPFKRKLWLIYGLILLMISLDTLMWALDIQTGIIDFLVTAESGQTEQFTIFGLAYYILLVWLVLTKDRDIQINPDVLD